MKHKFAIEWSGSEGLFREIAAFFSPQNLKQLLTNSVIQKRLFFTTILLALYYLSDLILIPTLDHSVIRESLSSLTQSKEIPQNLLGSSRLSILGLGLIPYFTACLFLQLSSLIVPYFHRLYHRYHPGEGKIALIDRYVLVLTIILSIIQAYLMSLWLENPDNFFGKKVILVNPPWFTVLTTSMLTGGTLILIAISKLINRYGVGNGIGLILATQILMAVPELINILLRLSLTDRLRVFELLAYIGLLGILVLWTLVFTIARKEIFIAFGKSDVAERVILQVPLHFSWVATAPVTFSAGIVLLPATLADLTGLSYFRLTALYLGSGNQAYFLTVALLVLFFTFFYFKALFSPAYLTTQVNGYGGKLLCPGSEEHEMNTSDLNKKFATVIWSSAAYLLFLVFLPVFASSALTGLPRSLFFLLGTDGAVVLVAVLCNTLERMHFLDSLSRQNVEYSKIFCAFTEIEAILKQGLLKSRGIDCLMEPIRFSWGVPIKTSLDRYNLYVPKMLANEGKALLGRFT